MKISKIEIEVPDPIEFKVELTRRELAQICAALGHTNELKRNDFCSRYKLPKMEASNQLFEQAKIVLGISYFGE